MQNYNVGKTKETGDIMLLRKNKQTILVENKDWTRPIVNAEVQKFVRDVEIQKQALFLLKMLEYVQKIIMKLIFWKETWLLYIFIM